MTWEETGERKCSTVLREFEKKKILIALDFLNSSTHILKIQG